MCDWYSFGVCGGYAPEEEATGVEFKDVRISMVELGQTLHATVGMGELHPDSPLDRKKNQVGILRQETDEAEGERVVLEDTVIIET